MGAGRAVCGAEFTTLWIPPVARLQDCPDHRQRLLKPHVRPFFRVCHAPKKARLGTGRAAFSQPISWRKISVASRQSKKYLSINNRSAATTLSLAVFGRNRPPVLWYHFPDPGVKTERTAKKSGDKTSKMGEMPPMRKSAGCPSLEEWAVLVDGAVPHRAVEEAVGLPGVDDQLRLLLAGLVTRHLRTANRQEKPRKD